MTALGTASTAGHHLVANAIGTRAYVSHPTDGTISVLDLLMETTLAEIALGTGTQPTSLLLHPDMVDMDYAVNTEGKSYLPDGHFDKSVDPFGRPSRWSEGEGHFAIEIAATPEGVVGRAQDGAASKAKRPMAAILKYLTLWHDDILAAFPA